jgi:hypothetical protein
METSNFANLVKDKNLRMRSLYKIVNKEGKTITFRPNKAQEYFLENRHNRNIILKSRRLGFTTFGAIDMIDNTLFTKNYRSLMLSYDEDSSKKIFDDQIMYAWNSFNFKSLYQVDTNSAKMLKLLFGDKDNSYSTVEVKSSGRGGRYDYLHISEFGKICARNPLKAREILAGTIPSITPLGTINIESTAEGSDGEFHDMFWDAWDRPTHIPLTNKDYKAFFFNWQWDEEEIAEIKEPNKFLPKEFIEYQRKHNEKCKINKNLKEITDIELTYWYGKFVECGKKWGVLLENYPTVPEEAFASSGRKMFDLNKLSDQEQYATTPNIIGDWSYYEMPKLGHSYILGADPSEGIGSDHSAVTVIDITKDVFRVVATYKNNMMPPDLFADELANKGLMYNSAFIVPEKNNMGYATVSRLKEIYPVHLIYAEERTDKETDKILDSLGWRTTSATKPKMMYRLANMLNEDALIIPDKTIIHEMRVYDKHEILDTRADENKTNHFDLLMSLAMAVEGSKVFQAVSEQVISHNPNLSTNDDPFSAI